jgi:hypothetical protein
MKTNEVIPLIKEYRVDKIKKCLDCINKYPFNRDKQKECLLELYPTKEDKSREHKEKSIFRGMIIPSLRHLGLIIGYADLIRLSANGKLIVDSENIGNELHQRVLGAVIFEIDRYEFGFMTILQENPLPIQHILILLNNDVLSQNQQRQMIERIKKWCSILEQVGLVNNQNGILSLDVSKYEQTLLDMDINQKDKNVFEEYLIKSYFELGKENAGIVVIADLREKVALRFLEKNNAILTEGQFDEILRNLPFITDDYMISFGRSMGADEKLFKNSRGEYFKTLSIKKLGV